MTEIIADTLEELWDTVDSAGEAVVLFTAPAWCIPCRQFEPHWTMAQDRLTDLHFIKVDLGEKPEDTGNHWATSEFGIRGVPTVKFFDDLGGVHDIKARALIPFIKEVESRRE